MQGIMVMKVNRKYLLCGCLLFGGCLDSISVAQLLYPIKLFKQQYTIANKYEPVSQLHFQYDNYGRPIGSVFYKWVNNNWQTSYITRKNYDNRGNMVTEESETFDPFPTETRRLYKNTNEYNEANKLIKSTFITTEYYINQTLNSEQTINFTYDQNGCKIKDEYSWPVNGINTITHTVKYGVTDKCRIISQQENYLTAPYSTVWIFKYQNDLMISEFSYHVSNNDSTLTFELQNTYDATGNLLQSFSPNNTRLTNKYTNNQNVYSKWEHFVDSSWVKGEESIYQYEGDDLLRIETLHYNYYYPFGPTYRTIGQNFWSAAHYIDSAYYDQIEYIGNGDSTVQRTNYKYTRRCDGAEIESVIGAEKTQTTYLTKASCEVVEQPDLTLFPNPTTGPLTIFLQSVSTDTQIEIYSSSGMLVKTYNTSEISNPIDLLITDLPAGLYLVRVYYNNTSSSSRFIKL